MVAIEQAVESSKQVLGHIMPEFAHLEPEIEEFQLDDDQGLWIITFRARNPQPRGEGENSARFSRLISKKWLRCPRPTASCSPLGTAPFDT